VVVGATEEGFEQIMKTNSLAVVGLMTLLALAGCGIVGNRAGSQEGRSFGSNGERIYFTATDASGQAITYQGGPSGSAMAGGGMTGQLACATCHGSEGHGGQVTLMMQTFDAPNITWPVLTGPDASMDHPPYSVETLKQAITAGVDPAGHPLKAPMPRWSMSPADLNDLEGYLQTLR
jgi:cytochrome c oxidase subunit II